MTIEQNAHIYEEKETERKNGIKDNILSRKAEHEMKKRKTLYEWKGERMSLNECAAERKEKR